MCGGGGEGSSPAPAPVQAAPVVAETRAATTVRTPSQDVRKRVLRQQALLEQNRQLSDQQNILGPGTVLGA